MTKKEEKEEKKIKSKFDLETRLSNVNCYLKDGFIEYIRNEKVTSQKQFDKLYNKYKGLR